MKTRSLKHKFLTNSQQLLTIFVLACAALGTTATSHAIPILESFETYNVGDNDGVAYEFTFENPLAFVDVEFEVALMELLDYESLGISITDNTGALVVPLMQSNPGSSQFFTFRSSASDFTALVFAEGNGAFELGIDASPSVASVPEPGTLGLVSVALIGMYWARRRRLKRPQEHFQTTGVGRSTE